MAWARKHQHGIGRREPAGSRPGHPGVGMQVLATRILEMHVRVESGPRRDEGRHGTVMTGREEARTRAGSSMRTVVLRGERVCFGL